MARPPANPMLVLGIMSGTSIDAVDYALCRVTPARVRLARLWRSPFPHLLRQRLLRAANDQASTYELGLLHHDLGRLYARGARLGLRGRRPDLVGLHGQTVFHHPHRAHPATLQLGEPAYLAEALRVPVVSNFRAADLAAGGQGAPLATLFHQIEFARNDRHVCVNNLGGISNVTSLDWRHGRKPKLLAFDTGPANVLIDLAMRHFTAGRRTFDPHGAWASRGTVAEKPLADWLRHPYFRRPPPKSTGRESFGEPLLAQARRQMASSSPYDLLATLTEFTARSLALNYRLHLPCPPDLVILTGGGAANTHLTQRIHSRLRQLNPATNVITCEKLGWPTSSIEPAAFALLAYYRWIHRPANLTEATGARRPVLSGQITEP